MTTSNKGTKPVGTKGQQQQQPKHKLAWNQCKKCQALIQKLNNEEHLEANCSDFNSVISLDKPFLFRNHAYLSLIEHTKEITKDLNLSKDFLFYYAFINPSTMQLSGLKLGDLILVKHTSQVYFLAICWPTNQVENWQISLSKETLRLNGLQATNSNDTKTNLSIFKLNKNICDYQALEIAVELIDSDGCDLVLEGSADDDDDSEATGERSRNDLDLILGFLKEKYLNKFLLENQQVLLVYMGKKLIFQTMDVVKGNIKRNKKKDTNSMDFITEKLTEVSLADSNQFLNKEKLTEKECFSDKLEPVALNSEQFKVVDSYDSQMYNQLFQITSKTKFSLKKNSSNESKTNQESDDANTPQITFKDLAGLDKEIDLLKECFSNPIEFRDLYESIGLNTNAGILLFGPSGCGKTSLARAACNEFKHSFIELKISDIYSRNYSETETKLKEIFDTACRMAPSIIFIDEIDNFCSRKESMTQDIEKKILTLFTTLVDQTRPQKVSLLCTTNKIDSIDLGLRRPGRLDKEIEISIPNQSARYKILGKKLNRLSHKLTDEELLEIAQNCHGYVGSDLDLLVQEAGLNCVKRMMAHQRSQCTKETAKNIVMPDLHEALHKIKPSAMKEITFDIPKVYWNQIGGQHDLKKKLEQAIIWPIKYADSFKRLNIKAPRGLLMYGPPGCSKTMIAKALATETGLNFIAVKGPELFSKWVGESERMVREIFRKARNAAPSIIFFDEIDAVAMERSSSANKSNNVGDRVLAQILNEMDGVENLVDVTVVAATNRPDMIDKALMRPGRLDRIVYVRLPDEETRKEIFELKFRQVPVASDIDIEQLVKKTEKYSGAEIAALCNEAAFLALDGNMNATHVNMGHIEDALSLVVPRTSDETIKYFDGFSFNSGLSEI